MELEIEICWRKEEITRVISREKSTHNASLKKHQPVPWGISESIRSIRVSLHWAKIGKSSNLCLCQSLDVGCSHWEGCTQCQAASCTPVNWCWTAWCPHLKKLKWGYLSDPLQHRTEWRGKKLFKTWVDPQ